MIHILTVFLLVPFILLTALFFIGDYRQKINDFLVIMEIHYAMSLAFIQTYPVLRIEIPTFKILLLLKEANSKGLTKLELSEQISESEMFRDRVMDLSNDDLISYNDGIIGLKPLGRFLAQIFYHYRRLLGFSPGGG
tara:strand:+ start:495 stop:905 length:411 start_codon:yes stop_codon:yes gene_type:complete